MWNNKKRYHSLLESQELSVQEDDLGTNIQAMAEFGKVGSWELGGQLSVEGGLESICDQKKLSNLGR